MVAAVTNQVVAYRARNLVNGKHYIGVTKRGLGRREHEHRYAARKGSTDLLHKAIRKYGEKIVFETLFNFDGDYELAMIYEAEAVEKEKPAYNLIPGGRNRVGPLHPSTLAKMRASHVGQVSSRKGEQMPVDWVNPKKGTKMPDDWIDPKRGVKHTAEARERMRQAQIRRWERAAKEGKMALPRRRKYETAEERNAAISALKKGQPGAFTGRRHTEESKAKMRSATVGRVGYWTGKTRPEFSLVQVKCENDGRVFRSMAEAERFYGLARTSIGAALRKNRLVRGLKFSSIGADP